jgi:hypothetical protein
MVSVFLSCKLEDQLRFHKGRHEIPTVHRATLLIRFLSCKEPLRVSGHNVIDAVRRFVTKAFQDSLHRVAATTLALVGNDLVVRILEVSELGHAVYMRDSRSHVCRLRFLGACD